MVQHSDTVTSGKGEWWRFSLPLYIHFFAVLDHIKKQMAADLRLKKRQPYKAIAEKEKAYFLDLYENASFDTLVADLLAVPFGGMTSDDFEGPKQTSTTAERSLTEKTALRLA